jgi:hypothetical protein
MKTPQRLTALVEEGLVDEVIGQLMSGKEATVYVVRCGEAIRCAKVYKDANQRSFRKNAPYQEGRKVKNSRQARAMEKGSRYGRRMQEEVWQSAEVDALYRLAAAGVRVPQPHAAKPALSVSTVQPQTGLAADLHRRRQCRRLAGGDHRAGDCNHRHYRGPRRRRRRRGHARPGAGAHRAETVDSEFAETAPVSPKPRRRWPRPGPAWSARGNCATRASTARNS